MVETNPEGVYYDMPASRYHAAQGVSNSMLKHLARSPAHLQARLEQPEEQTSAMLFGQIVHQLLLEPEKPWGWAVRPPGLDGRSKEGKEWKERVGDKPIIDHQEWLHVEGAVASVRCHPTARLALGRGRSEVSVFKNFPAGTEVFVIRKADLTTWESSRRNLVQTYKLQPFLLEQDLDLSEAASVTVNIARRAYRPLRPRNLRVFGDGVNPSYTTGQDIDCHVDFPSEKRSASETSVTETLSTNLSRIVVEVRAMDGTLKTTLYFDDETPFTITNAQIVAALGSQTDFKLRAFTERNGYRSSEYDEIIVWKV